MSAVVELQETDEGDNGEVLKMGLCLNIQCILYMGENTVFLAPKIFFLIFLGLLVIEMRDIGIGSV